MNKMEIQATKLIDLVETIKPVVTTNMINDIASFALHDSMVIAKNNSCLLSINLDHPFNNAVLPFNQFNELINKIPPTRRVKLYESGSKLKVSFGTGTKIKTTASIPLLNLLEHPDIIPSEELLPPVEDETREIPIDFAEGLKMCNSTLPKEALNFAMTLFYVDDDKIISSDEARMSRYTMQSGFDTKFLISRDNANIIINSDFSEYCIHDNYIEFVGGDSMARIALPTEKYPDINDNVFHGDNPVDLTFTTSQFTSALERTTIFSEGTSDMAMIATLFTNKGGYEIQASNQYGRNVEKGKVRMSRATDLEIRLNPMYLLQIFNLIGGKKTTANVCEFPNGYKIILEKDNFKYVLASYVS